MFVREARHWTLTGEHVIGQLPAPPSPQIHNAPATHATSGATPRFSRPPARSQGLLRHAQLPQSGSVKDQPKHCRPSPGSRNMANLPPGAWCGVAVHAQPIGTGTALIGQRPVEIDGYSMPVRPGVQKGLVRIWRRSQPRSVISIFRKVWMVRASPAR